MKGTGERLKNVLFLFQQPSTFKAPPHSCFGCPSVARFENNYHGKCTGAAETEEGEQTGSVDGLTDSTRRHISKKVHSKKHCKTRTNIGNAF